jgi:hypothetical protein
MFLLPPPCVTILLLTSRRGAGRFRESSVSNHLLLSRFSIDTSLDVHFRGSVFGYGAVTYAPFDILDKSGVPVKLEGLTGGYHYNTERDPHFFSRRCFPYMGISRESGSC